MKTDVTVLFEAIVSLLSAVITCFIIPLIKQRFSNEKQQKIKFWVNEAVKAAEQLYKTSSGQEKKEYVVSFLLSKGLVFDVDEVSAMIESSVYEMINSSSKDNVA